MLAEVMKFIKSCRDKGVMAQVAQTVLANRPLATMVAHAWLDQQSCYAIKKGDWDKRK